jgi:prepilin-type N-terminal cleavage/methylation domain-containing protein
VLPVRKVKGFTLVELLVVIGIIALLISILLPALSKARDQANAIACQAGERQFYAVWSMYAVDYKGYALPATLQGVNVEWDFCNPMLIGNELGKSTNNSGSVTNMNQAYIIKTLFTCPAADHSGQLNTDTVSGTGNLAMGTSTSGYWGDYIYNYYTGVIKVDNGNGIQYPFYPYTRLNQIPDNVILLMESIKPNANTPAAIAGTYKCYFASWPDLFNSAAPAPKKTTTLTFNRIGTYHSKRTKMNVVCADGHIALVDPKKDFFVNPNLQTTVKEFLWDRNITTPGSESGGVIKAPIFGPTAPTAAFTEGLGWLRGRPGV